jgi:hypothetical protein
VDKRGIGRRQDSVEAIVIGEALTQRRNFAALAVGASFGLGKTRFEFIGATPEMARQAIGMGAELEGDDGGGD